MIQLNLLPDIKVQFIKGKRAKRVVMVAATLSIVVSVAILAIMISLTMFQRRHISDLNRDIISYEKTLQDTPDLAKILTIQNQLQSLPGLYANRPVVSRLFPYIEQTTPAKIGIAHIVVSFVDSTINISGTSDSLESVNRYVDTLKFTTYVASDVSVETKAFTNVVLASFGRDNQAATYSITLKFDPVIFNNAKTVKLSVPKTVTTRSETELPGAGVFKTGTTN